MALKSLVHTMAVPDGTTCHRWAAYAASAAASAATAVGGERPARVVAHWPPPLGSVYEVLTP